MTDAAVVRVVITTFNHQRYVTEAVESVLLQEAPFPYEVVVIDDCSTDGTVDELERLATRYPQRFTVVQPPANRNDLHDFGAALDECTAPYLAMLDGDDYWTSTTKLARQVEFLDAHPEFALACHAVHPVDESGAASEVQYDDRRTRYSRDDLWSACFIHTGSVVFRRSAFDRLPAWYFESVAGDWELFLLLTLRGDVWFDPERMSVYRVHAGGLWSGSDSRRQAAQVHEFYRHQQRAWGRGFTRNRAATLSRAVTLAFRYGEAGQRVKAWRWLTEAMVRSAMHPADRPGPSRADVKRMVAWRIRSDRDHVLRRDRVAAHDRSDATPL